MTMPVFNVDEAIVLLEEERATVIYPAFPNVVHALLAHPRFARADLSAIRLMLNVGSPAVLQEFQDAFPQSVQISGFGLTETSGLVVLSDIEDDQATRLETCGRPFRGVEVKVVDENRRQLPAGARGELAVRGFCVFEGYQGSPDRTREVLDDEGWFYSGDLGSLDDRGLVYFHGRIKDVFKVGGENVGAAEVEAFLNSHPAVKISQVVAVPDQRLAAVPAAFVELRHDAQLDADELIAYCRTRIASYKVPRHVRFVDEWPMSTTKIQKFRLREQLLVELGLAPEGKSATDSSASVGPPTRGRH
jgi:fatty-acyl-CoA synthase